MNITEDIAEKDITIQGKKYVDILKKLTLYTGFFALVCDI